MVCIIGSIDMKYGKAKSAIFLSLPLIEHLEEVNQLLAALALDLERKLQTLMEELADLLKISLRAR